MAEMSEMKKVRDHPHSKKFNDDFIDNLEKTSNENYVREYGKGPGFDSVRSHEFIHRLPDKDKALLVEEYKKEQKERAFYCLLGGTILLLLGMFILVASFLSSSSKFDTYLIMVSILFIIVGVLLMITKDYFYVWLIPH
jgi:hypothetical protein